MLLELFSIDICSLIFDVVRLVIIVLFIIDDEFKIDDIKVKKIIIKLVKWFIYEEVQNIIDDDFLVGEFSECILFLFKFVKFL